SLNWKNMSVVNMVDDYPSQAVAMMIECGTDDFFYQVNETLHKKLLAMKIPHDYVQRPGAHTWEYWANAVEYQLLFFRKHFNQK
ncbi:MAG: esterase family protein, partial [Bacteroidetes bacterium]|nr:esterase family protein [Bacteroidota bacterium]